MTLVNISEVFNQCEYPFYKKAEVQNTSMQCTLYSTATSYTQEIQLSPVNFESAVHQLSIALIHLRSYEWMNQQQEIMEKAM